MSHDPLHDDKIETETETEAEANNENSGGIDNECGSDDSYAGNSYDREQLCRIIEGAILAAGEALTVDKLHGLFEEHEAPGKDVIRDILGDIAGSCEGRGFQLVEVASGWRFQVREDVATWVNRLWDEKPQKYSRAMLETLALIAYRQPLTRGDIEDVRGVAVSSHIIKTLVEREWVKVVGHRDVPGRPSLYATTRQFLDYFNLKSLDELPTLSELKDIDSPNGSLDWGDGASAEEAVEDTAKDTSEDTQEPAHGLPEINDELLDQSVLDDSASEVSDEDTESDDLDDNSPVVFDDQESVEVREVDIPLQFDQDKSLPNPASAEVLSDEAEMTLEQVEFAEAKHKREAEEELHKAGSDEPDSDENKTAGSDKYAAHSLFANPDSDEDSADHPQGSPEDPANEHQ